MDVLIFLILSLPIFLFFLLKATRKTQFPPGPSGLPFIGNLHQLQTSNLHKHLWQLSQKYGPLMSLRLGFKPTIVVSSAKMAQEVMKTHDLEFCGRPSLTGQQKLSYNGLTLAFAPYGDTWREMKKICVMHLFSPARVQCFRPIREEEVSILLETISESALNSKPFNLTNGMEFLTSRIISRAAFGKSYEEGRNENYRFQELKDKGRDMFIRIFLSDYFPYVGWILDRLTGVQHRLEKVFEDFEAFHQELIDEHLNPKRPKPESKDIIDIMLEMHKDPSSKVHITLDHIKGILLDMIFGGTDTSSTTVIWAMTFLMKNPKVMRKAQVEIRNLIGHKGFVDEDDIPKLTYLKAVIKETMRLQAPAPLLVQRETNDKCNLDGYEIPAKTLVFVNAWAIGRDPETWEDPYEFYPDRFLGSSIDMKGNDFELIPFGAGRRICPGIHMGIANVELPLANLLYKFDWEMPSNGIGSEDICMDEVLPGIAPRMKDDLFLLPKSYN